MIMARFLIMARLLQDKSFEVTFLFSMFGLVMTLLLLRLPFLGTALQAHAASFLFAPIE
jgi:hypothetical protein